MVYIVFLQQRLVLTYHRYHEVHPLEYDLRTSNTSIIARGPGMLSAVAIGLSPSLMMLPSISEDITRVAFRFGLVVDKVCRSLEVSPNEINSEGAWVYCVYGVDVDDARQAVAKFNTENVSYCQRPNTHELTLL
jgi:monodictyphenone polyketide synthase